MVKCIEAESCGEKFLIPVHSIKAFGKGKILAGGVMFSHDLPDEEVIKLFNREKNNYEAMYDRTQEVLNDSEVY